MALRARKVSGAFEKRPPVHPEEDRQVGRNIGGLENVSYLRLCLIYCFMKKTSTHIGCL